MVQKTLPIDLQYDRVSFASLRCWQPEVCAAAAEKEDRVSTNTSDTTPVFDGRSVSVEHMLADTFDRQ